MEYSHSRLSSSG